MLEVVKAEPELVEKVKEHFSHVRAKKEKLPGVGNSVCHIISYQRTFKATNGGQMKLVTYSAAIPFLSLSGSLRKEPGSGRATQHPSRSLFQHFNNISDRSQDDTQIVRQILAKNDKRLLHVSQVSGFLPLTMVRARCYNRL